jgi:ABC-type uncharacterized transport system permease subunit
LLNRLDGVFGVVEFHQLAAAIYQAAGIGALVGVVLPSRRMNRGATWGLALGAAVQTIAFATMHRVEPVVPLTSLPAAVSVVAGLTVLGLRALMLRVRLPGLVAAVGPIAFLAVFAASLWLDGHDPSETISAGAWPHAHVLLASGGISLLGIAGLAGLFFLVEHKRLKTKRPVKASIPLPSLEALDRINVVATAVGFALLSLGVLTGMLWLREAQGTAWMGTTHEAWMVIAWAIYAGLVAVRFAGRQGARQAAASSLAGFAFLVVGVVGVGLLG